MANTKSGHRNAFGVWLAIGTGLQLLMVISGHFLDPIAQLFAIGGVSISLIAGAGFGASSSLRLGRAAGRGGLVGGGCALIGIAVSCALGDVEPIVLTFGTASSAVAGCIGAVVSRSVVGPRGAAHAA